MTAHTITVAPVRSTFHGTRHQASCSCGWKAPLLEMTSGDARTVGEMHAAAMAREVTL